MTASRLPRFRPDAHMVMDTDNGLEEWTGRRWNAYADDAERHHTIITVRFVSISPPNPDSHLAEGTTP